jgi:uncharacterized protein YgbK (DUF1537 family)
MRVLIVADDLTGAMDAAGPFAQDGKATWVVADALACEAQQVARADVVSLNTASRHLPAAQAARNVAQCAQRFAARDFDVVFKKIDSTLRGNVVAETLSLMRACGRDSALVAPSFPGQKRTMLGGVVHVDSVSLEKTGFARDALSPPPRGPLTQVFSRSAHEATVVAWPAGRPGVLRRNAIHIADALSDADLDRALDAIDGRMREVLLVGSAGLGQALARRLPASVAVRANPDAIGPLVFVVGSRAEMSRKQADALAASNDTVVLDAPNGILSARPPAGVGGGNVVLRSVPDPVAGEGDAAEVARRLAAGALELVRNNKAAAVVATGGDTAVALLAATGCPALQVLGDLMPGIPYARLQIDGRPVWLVTKAGGFGEPSTFVDIARRLRAAGCAGVAAAKEAG